MFLRELVPTAFAVAAPAALNAITALDVPVVATATLLAVIMYGFRAERRLGNVETKLGEHGRILESVKTAMQRL